MLKRPRSRRLAILALGLGLMCRPRVSAAADTIPPTTPAGLSAVGVSCSRVDLVWQPSSDAGGTGLKGYKLYRSGYYVAFIFGASTSTSQLPLAASASYTFAVSAIDFGGNESAPSPTLTVNTPACPDRTAPPSPTGLTAVGFSSCTRIDLAWNPVVDAGGAGLRGYRIYRGGALAHEVPAASTSSADTDLLPGTTYDYAVTAIDNAGNESLPGLPASATTATCVEQTAPGVPSELTATAAGCNQVNLSWAPSGDPGAAPTAAYDVYRNGLFIARVFAPVTQLSDVGLSPVGEYSYAVLALDAAGNPSAETAPAGVATPECPDTTPPTTPTGLTAVTSSCTQVELAWGPSIDIGSAGLKGYRIYRNGVYVKRVTTTSASDPDLAPATTYSYAVAAVDFASNRSPKSNVAVVTTPACGNLAPIADAGPDQAVQTLTAVTFSGTGSSDPDGTIASYAWTFGDGSAASGPTVTHTYLTGGSHAVTLTVTDSAGQVATDTALAQVLDRLPVAAAGPDRVTTSGAVLAFDGAGSYDPDGRIVTYAWTFNDGTSGSGATTTHAFARPGTYLVALTVTDDSGSTASDTASVVVTNQAPVAHAGPDQAASSDAAIALDGSASSDSDGHIVDYAWQLGDGATVTGASVSHTYASPGTYVATLTVTDDLGASATDTTSITVTAPLPSADTPWAQRVGGPSYDEAKAIAIDPAGNIVVTGQASGPIDLGGGWICTDSIFVAEYTPAGAVRWARCPGSHLGGGSGRAVAVAPNGDVIVTGYFRGTVDLGGGPLASPDGFDIFLARYSATGAHRWSRRFGSPVIGAIVNESGNGLAVDPAGNIVLTGTFESTVDFGGGPLTSAGQQDIFVAKFTPAGAHLWSRAYGGLYADTAGGLAVDAAGDVIVTGSFLGTVDFGAGPLTASSADTILLKLSPTGTHLWSRRFGGSLGDEGRAVAVDPQGNIVVSGTFNTVVNFGGAALTSIGGNDVFLAKYTPEGVHLWSEAFGGLTNFDASSALAVDTAGNILLTGYFARSIDFGTGPLASAGSKDVFVAGFSPAGVVQWAQRYGGTGIDVGNAIAVDAAGNLVVGGAFYGAVDFGAGPLTSAGDADIFVLRLVP